MHVPVSGIVSMAGDRARVRCRRERSELKRTKVDIGGFFPPTMATPRLAEELGYSCAFV